MASGICLARGREVDAKSAEALELTLLIAQKEPHRHPRVPARWLLRYLEEESDEGTIEQAAMATSCLVALNTDEDEAKAREAVRCHLRCHPALPGASMNSPS